MSGRRPRQKGRSTPRVNRSPRSADDRCRFPRARNPEDVSPSRWFEQHHWDGPLARALLVHLVAVVVVIDQAPQFLTLGAFGLTRVNRDAPPADLDRDCIRMRAQIVVTGRVMVRACLGGD